MTGAAKLFLALSTLLVMATLMTAFVIIPSSSQQRIYDLDAKRVEALDILSSAVDVYVVKHNKLPATLDELNADIRWSKDASRDTQTGQPYVYATAQGLDYRLCATFDARSRRGATGFSEHPAGLYCEARTASTHGQP